MKRAITLYIGESRADIADDGFVLFNYALANLTNPAVQRNSWSQGVTLPRTPGNDAIFGEAFRLDRNAGAGGTGAAFSASRKTPFTIYADSGEVLAAGYCKLTSVTRDGYEVQLFGGLGELVYNLSYDADGNKRTLASLDYGVVLDFTINASAVTDAWARMAGDTSKPAKWDIINFAPCYNGIPGNDFSADKALAKCADVSIPSSATGSDGVTTYSAQSGYSLVSLSEAVDEWAVKDLRSYLQRPVLNVWKMLQAIADPANNGGWTIDLTDINDTTKWPYRDAWLTRPLIPSLGTFKQDPGSATITTDYSAYTTGTNLGGYDLNLGGAPTGTQVTAKMRVQLSYNIPSAASDSVGALDTTDGVTRQVLIVQALGYDSSNVKVAASASYVLDARNFFEAAEDVAAQCGYTPDALNADYIGIRELDYLRSGASNNYLRRELLEMTIIGPDIASVEIIVKAYSVAYGHGTGGTAPYTKLYSLGSSYAPTMACFSDGDGEVTLSTSDGLRSGSRITKEMLLTTSATPAEYLLSICKVFGLYLLTDSATKTAKVLRRTSLYTNEVIDLSERIDRSREMELVPLAFDARWYDWKLPASGGAFEKEYEATEGVQYGMQRVDTNYDFDAQAKDVLSGAVLKSCAAILGASKYFCHALNGGDYSPGVFLYPGCTQTLWDASGNGEDFNVPVANPAGLVAEGGINPYHDSALAGRAEFRDKDGKGLDGADCLLLYAGVQSMQWYQVSDDTALMSTLNGGTPCWLLDDGGVIDIPTFTLYDNADGIYLDFGAPRQIALLGFDYDPDATIYAQAWRDYIRDRLSASGKVLRCRVRLDGLQVGTELLRKFYWYGGSLWVINSISNYSLTTFDPAEVELVQVRDKDAYLNGQY